MKSSFRTDQGSRRRPRRLLLALSVCLLAGPALAQVDTDADGVQDANDNCLTIQNPLQTDADSDGFGNLCDTDLSNDCVVNFIDLGIFRAAFFGSDPVADFNSDGDINFIDLGVMRDYFFAPPGPSGAPNICAPDLDRDGDGLTDGDELQVYGTDPSDADTDDDGLDDGLEIALALNPLLEDSDGNGVNDADEDADADGIGNLAEIQNGLDPLDSGDAELDPDADGLNNRDEINLLGTDINDADSDDDGVDDAQDSYPLDNTRSQLDPVLGIATSLAGTAVTVSWSVHPDPQVATGYYVDREDEATGDVVRLTPSPLPLATLTLSDAAVINGQGYRYAVVAVDQLGNAGQAAPSVEQFVAYNQTTVANLVVMQNGTTPELRWDAAPPASEYRVYRAIASAYEFIVQTSELTFADASALIGQSYNYRVLTLRSFTNVFDGASVEVEGPVGDTVNYVPGAVDTFAITVDDAVPGPGSTLELLVLPVDARQISGQYGTSMFNAALTATAGVDTVSSLGRDGDFRLVLPASNPGPWTLTAIEQGGAGRTDTVEVALVFDTVAPVVTLDPSLPAMTTAATLRVVGSAIDDRSGLVAVTVVNDRFGGTQFAAALDDGGAFVADVPLERGQNLLTARAEDRAGNLGMASVTLARAVDQLPSISVFSPVGGATVTTPNIAVSGRVYTSLPPDEVRLLLGNALEFPGAGTAQTGYPFSFAGVPLTPGSNELVIRAETVAGNVQRAITVIYDDGQSVPPPDPDPPVIDLDLAGDQVVVLGVSYRVSGSVSGDVNAVTINGSTTALTNGRFSANVDLSTCVDELAVEVSATDQTNGLGTSVSFTIVCDAVPPEITLLSPALLAPPAVNPAAETPLALSGTVADPNLASFSINGQTVGLVPDGDGVAYSFAGNVALANGSIQTITLEAWDAGGSTTSAEYLVSLDVPVQIVFLSPTPGSTITTQGGVVAAEVVARIVGLAPDNTVSVSLNGGAPEPMALSGNVATTTLSSAFAEGNNTLRVAVDDSGGEIAAATANVLVRDVQNVPLAVVSTTPDNLSVNNAPNEPVSVYFNRSVDPALVSLQMRQTVHGRDYDLQSQDGLGFTELREPQLIQVDKDLEPVPGGLAFYPENLFVTFHPDERLPYGAEVFVDVLYDGAAVARFTYTVQALPTIIGGLVADQFGAPLEGIRVEIQALGLSGRTNVSGNYVFGSGSVFSEALPGGRYRVNVNPNRVDPRFGNVEVWASVQEGRLNTLDAVRIPVLDPTVSFAAVATGDAAVALVGGDLQLDLSAATLTFPDGRRQGLVHAQFMTTNQLPFQPIPGAMPYWMFALQPSGIAVQGQVSVRMAMPPLFGSYDYLPPQGSLVAIVAFEPQQKVMTIVGVGEIGDREVVSSAPLGVSSLDYLGYAFVNVEAHGLLMQYRDSEIASLPLLQSLLEQAYREATTGAGDAP